MEIRESSVESGVETVEFEGFAVKSAGSTMENADCAMENEDPAMEKNRSAVRSGSFALSHCRMIPRPERGQRFILKNAMTGHSRSAAETAEGKWHG